MEKKLTKFDALRILGHAYWHIATETPTEAMAELLDKFHNVRRSLRLEDMKPQVCKEGYNGRMPTQF